MSAKEYLNQAREIDALIHSKLRELDYWRDLSRRISGSHFEEQHNPNRPSDAPFARCICKIDELERDISHMVDEYVDLQKSVSQWDFEFGFHLQTVSAFLRSGIQLGTTPF